MQFEPLLQLMAQKKASDMFITTNKEPSLKIDGMLVPVGKTKLNLEQARELVTGVMTASQREEFDQTGEANFSISHNDLGRFRVSAFRQRDACGMVLRRIEMNIPSVEGLHLPPILNDLSMTKRGLILFVGATGSGKSSSLAALINYRNEHSSGHIITIEDPLEFVHPHKGCIITQREVGMDTQSYSVALKNTLRQAPDVILIGEIRTRETMQQAITFAETGHLCLSTLHANNANQAIDRIIHFFPEEMHPQLFMDLSLNLKAVIAQQLIKKSEGQGRYPALEILINTPMASDLIRKGEVHKLKELMKNSREQGMLTFDQNLFELYRSGKISYDDALNAADSRNEVRLLIKLSDESNYQSQESENPMSFDPES